MTTVISGDLGVTFPDVSTQAKAGLVPGGTIANGTVTTLNTNGIAFPATQVASADANTLDDYEEGTWTPFFTTSSGSLTYTSQTGNYVKIGKQVTVTFNVAINVSTSGVSNSGIGGLPFAASNTNYAGASFAYFGVGLFNGYSNMQGLIGTGTEIQLRGTNNGAVAPALVFAGITLTNGTQIAGTLTYFTA
jgi:hypothetical protein